MSETDNLSGEPQKGGEQLVSWAKPTVLYARVFIPFFPQWS